MSAASVRTLALAASAADECDHGMATSSPASARPHLVLINAALGGSTGNTASALARVRRQLTRRARVTTLTLADGANFESVRDSLASADSFVIGTGTHWDSWSSLLQKFLEDATPAEGTSLWLGKPVACVVTEHSTGGKGILSRLQGVLVTLGCQIPPMSGVVISRASLLAARHDQAASQDFWSCDDLRVAAHNLLEAAAGTQRWKAWSVERTGLTERWLEEPAVSRTR